MGHKLERGGFRQANRTIIISGQKTWGKFLCLNIGDPLCSIQTADLQKYVQCQWANLTGGERIWVGSEEGLVNLKCMFGTKLWRPDLEGGSWSSDLVAILLVSEETNMMAVAFMFDCQVQRRLRCAEATSQKVRSDRLAISAGWWGSHRVLWMAGC